MSEQKHPEEAPVLLRCVVQGDHKEWSSTGQPPGNVRVLCLGSHGSLEVSLPPWPPGSPELEWPRRWELIPSWGPSVREIVPEFDPCVSCGWNTVCIDPEEKPIPGCRAGAEWARAKRAYRDRLDTVLDDTE